MEQVSGAGGVDNELGASDVGGEDGCQEHEDAEGDQGKRQPGAHANECPSCHAMPTASAAGRRSYLAAIPALAETSRHGDLPCVVLSPMSNYCVLRVGTSSSGSV